MTSQPDLKAAKQLMGALVRMKPKPHEKMKVGKSKGKTAKSPTAKAKKKR